MKLKNSALQELYDTIFSGGTVTFTVDEESPIDKAFKECDKKLSESITFATIKDLQDRNDILEQSNKHLLEANMESISKTRKLEKELDFAKNGLEYARHSRDTWRSRAKHAEGEAEDLKKLIDIKNEEISELTKNYQDLSIKLKRWQINVGRESRYLWDMLQEVSDYYYFGGDDEFDTDDCEMTSMTDIIDNLNVDQFLEAYKNWHKAQEQHRLDRMRDWLYDFCSDRFCPGCPLESSKYKCGRGYSFKGANPLPDEDVERYYEKARKTWTCTLEGTVEIDKDLLNKICGIDSDD